MSVLESSKDDDSKQELVECFVSEYNRVGSLTELSGFLRFNAQVSNKLLYTNANRMANIKVGKNEHTRACAIGSLYLQSLVLKKKFDGSVFVVLPNGEKTNDFDTVLKNPKYAKFLTRQLVDEIKEYNDYELIF